MPKYEYHWTFGDHSHIEFVNGSDPVLVTPNQAFKTDEGCAAMSDANGNLLFYTDGTNLYGTLNNTPINTSPLGGNSSSSHSAIIVPPAGGGAFYHIFATADWPNASTVKHTAVSAAGTTITIQSPTTPLGFGPLKASERLSAIPHKICSQYWVISMDGAAPAQGKASLYAMLVDSDLAPATAILSTYPYAPAGGYCCKISPDGSLLAISANETVDILSFDRATGKFSAHSQVTGCAGADRSYGVEFSPNGLYLYITGITSGNVNRHTIAAGTQALSATDLVGQSPTLVHPKYRVGALQLGPNRKIYGTKVFQDTLFEIADPDNAAAGSVGFNIDAVKGGGGTLKLNARAILGLPTFTRISDDCADTCRSLAAEIDRRIGQRELHNPMRPCKGEAEKPGCAPLEMPAIRPQTFIRWGDSRCDCIEGDDTEVMHLTLCNPYSNLTLSNVTVYELAVVDANGQAVPNLPDGSPSIQLVPVGPYCFDDIAPCSCVTREFVLRLRGAPGGPYRILVRGICFDACFHGDEEACFTFDVCKD